MLLSGGETAAAGVAADGMDGDLFGETRLFPLRLTGSNNASATGCSGKDGGGRARISRDWSGVASISSGALNVRAGVGMGGSDSKSSIAARALLEGAMDDWAISTAGRKFRSIAMFCSGNTR